jgi:hypothetical protein
MIMRISSRWRSPDASPWILAARAFAACVLAMSAAGCADPLVFADWTIPVPEGTRIVEYPGVTDEERAGEVIELVEDLAIGPRGEDENYVLFNPRPVKVDSRGNLYVLDRGNSRVQVFDANGEYLRTLGSAGSGPGEFQGSRGGFVQVDTIVAGDRLVAFDSAQSRLMAWSPDGEHLGDHVITEPRVSRFVGGFDDGTLAALTVTRIDEATRQVTRQTVVRLSSSGEQLGESISLPRVGAVMIGGRVGVARPDGDPIFAASRDGTVYATAGTEYQILSLDPEGSTRWALRVAHERVPFTDEDRTRILDLLRNNIPDLDDSGTQWPDRIGSIGDLAVDGHGHLYVYAMQPLYAPTPELVAVDVYAPDGERLFAGMAPPFRWTDAAGDFVYGTRRNEQTEEDEPVRYRLVEPF